MASKAFFLLGLFAVVLVITSEVAARDLAETSIDGNEVDAADKMANGVGDAKYGGYNGGYPDGGNYGGGNRGSYGGGRGYGCYHGCCRRNYYRVCIRCCSYAGEAVDHEVAATKPHN